LSALFLIEPPKVPVKDERTQNDNVTVLAEAEPHARSYTFNPSMLCRMRKKSLAPTEYADRDVIAHELVNPGVTTADC
jgi:hypothetical protein